MFSKKFALAAGVAITAVALTGAAAFPAFAHHAAPSVMFSPDTEVVLTGTVKEFRYSNPHGSLELLVPRGGQNVLCAAKVDIFERVFANFADDADQMDYGIAVPGCGR